MASGRSRDVCACVFWGLRSLGPLCVILVACESAMGRVWGSTPFVLLIANILVPNRWPRWTKELVDGPLLAAEGASPATLVISLCAGWRFPPVRLVR